MNLGKGRREKILLTATIDVKRVLVILVTSMLLFTIFFTDDSANGAKNGPEALNSGQYEKGHRYNIQGWVYIHIEGEPYERGYQYGYLASAEIIDTIQRWSNLGHDFKFMKLSLKKNLPENYDELSERWWNICRTKAMNTFVEQIPEEYQQELKGISDGVKAQNGRIFNRDIEYDDIVASQFVQDVWYSSFKYFYKSFHPVRGLFSGLKEIFSDEGENQHPGHCSAFIATGDATSDGKLVVAHSTIFNRYMAERCNIILDVQPSEGYRFIMTCPPGSIWSQEDYYQNEKGIVLTETELHQGPWKKIGVPKGARSRTAIQYSDSIDKVIENLKNGNNGLIPNEWLIGDTKTGEIASFEQALYNTPIKRTFNGFYWSTNVPHDKKVERELFGIISLSQTASKKCYDLYDGGRDEKFRELSNRYYGKIDVAIAKKILATDPICKGTTDGKITDSELMKDMGLLAFMGCPDGGKWNPTDDQKNKFHGITELPASGWAHIYPFNSEDYSVDRLTTPHATSDNKGYFGSWDGNIYSLDSDTGDINWKYQTNWGVVTTPAISDGLVFAGSLDNNFYAINEETGDLEWYFTCNSAIHSSPVVYGEYVFFGSDDGKIYALNKTDGNLAWSFAPEYFIQNDANNYLTTPILSSPVVKNGVACIDVNGKIYELDAQTKEIREDDLKSDNAKDYTVFLFMIGLAIVLLMISFIIKAYSKKGKRMEK